MACFFLLDIIWGLYKNYERREQSDNVRDSLNCRVIWLLVESRGGSLFFLHNSQIDSFNLQHVHVGALWTCHMQWINECSYLWLTVHIPLRDYDLNWGATTLQIFKSTEFNCSSMQAKAAASQTKSLLSFSCCNLHYFTCVLCYRDFKVKLRGLLV